jgi:hypothetical protein
MVLLEYGANAEIKWLNTKDLALDYAKEVGQMEYYELMQVKDRGGEVVVGRTRGFHLEIAARLKWEQTLWMKGSLIGFLLFAHVVFDRSIGNRSVTLSK